MKKTLLSIAIAFFTLSTIAQTFEVPTNYSFTGKSEYKKYETDILNCIEWLKNTPMNEEIAKRKEAEKFFMTWITGTSSVTIELSSIMGSVVKKNQSLLMPFFGGWTKLVLNSPDLKEDMVQGNLAGIRAALEVYESNRNAGIKRDKKLEKLKELDEKGELENWVKEQLGDD